MNVFGVTGGIGMGKSACAGLLRERSLPVVDTDDLARRVVELGQPALEEIARQFGPEIFGDDGRLQREKLARRVFADPLARTQLEAILHPRIRQLWKSEVELWNREARPCGFVIIPLLFETHAEMDLDHTICVACSATTQLSRLKARGWSDEEIERRIKAQLPIETKMSRSEFVVWTEGSLEVHASQLERIMASF